MNSGECEVVILDPTTEQPVGERIKGEFWGCQNEVPPGTVAVFQYQDKLIQVFLPSVAVCKSINQIPTEDL